LKEVYIQKRSELKNIESQRFGSWSFEEIQEIEECFINI
jgi:hypothetical protein